MGFWAVYMGIYGGGLAQVTLPLIVTSYAASGDAVTSGAGGDTTTEGGGVA